MSDIKTIVKIKNLTKNFYKKKIINNISFDLEIGETLGLIGSNGAGKTTLIHILLGILKPTDGSIYYFDKEFRRYRSEILQYVTFASNYIGLPKELTVQQNLEIYAQIYGLTTQETQTKINEYLSFFNMLKYKHQIVGSISSGSLAKVMLIKAFLTNPRIVILDEPTASLDTESTKQVREFIELQQKKYNISLIIASHNVEEIEQLCNKILNIETGKITQLKKTNLQNIINKEKLNITKSSIFNFTRIFAVIKRYLFGTYKNANKIITVIYWSFLNIVIWGTTSVWLSKVADIPEIMSIILTGLIFWQIVFRTNIETAKSLYSEIVNKNLINLFASPLTLSQWSIAIMTIGIIDMFSIICCGIIAVWLLYGLNILLLGPVLIPSIFLLLTFGWTIGFFICGLLLYFGQKAQDLIYSIGYLFVPFSAVYYPLSASPKWIQSISLLLPTTYVFETFRIKLTTDQIAYILLLKSFILSLIYIILAFGFFKFILEKSRTKGLSQIQ